jgi:hypothetical protein
LNVIEDEGMSKAWEGVDVPRPGMTYWLEKAEVEMRQ